MLDNFRIIRWGMVQHPNTPEEERLLKSMHRMRKKVFYDEKGWRKGLSIVNDEEEYDEYDTSDAYYLIHVNNGGEVDASFRLLPSIVPNMLNEYFAYVINEEIVLRLADKYPESIDPKKYLPFPYDKKIAEITRLGALRETLAQEGSEKAFAQMYVVCMKFALNAESFGFGPGISSYVAVTDWLANWLIRSAKWPLMKMGQFPDEEEGMLYAVSYDASEELMDKMCTRYHLDHTKIFDLEENKMLMAVHDDPQTQKIDSPANDNAAVEPPKRNGSQPGIS